MSISQVLSNFKEECEYHAQILEGQLCQVPPHLTKASWKTELQPILEEYILPFPSSSLSSQIGIRIEWHFSGRKNKELSTPISIPCSLLSYFIPSNSAVEFLNLLQISRISVFCLTSVVPTPLGPASLLSFVPPGPLLHSTAQQNLSLAICWKNIFSVPFSNSTHAQRDLI